MAKYLDQNGLLYFLQKIKTLFVAKETGKGLSTNDFTTEEKNKLAGIEEGANNYTLPTASASVLGGVKVGTGLEITGEGLLNATGGGTADSVEWTNVQNKPTTLEGYGITDAYSKTETYSKTEIDGKGYLTASSIENKADKATTLEGYGITDAYTESEVDGFLSAKANSTDVYLKTETYSKTELDGKLSSVYKPAGAVLFANLPTPSASNLGNVYSMLDAFTTDDRFMASEPVAYPIGTNVVVVEVEDEPTGTKYLFDVLAGFVDLSNYLEVTDMQAITNEEIDTLIAS